MLKITIYNNVRGTRAVKLHVYLYIQSKKINRMLEKSLGSLYFNKE